MKITKHIRIKLQRIVLAGAALVATSCTFDEQIDPNGPSLQGVLTNATSRQLNEMVVGVEARMRNSMGIQTTGSGTMARELYLFDADPRNTEDLLGKNGTSLDNNSFYSTAPWAARYRSIKNANILIEAALNTESISAEEASGYIGFAKTIKAYELIQILKSYNRARIDVADPENLGPILEFGEAMDNVRLMLDEALSDINAAGDAFTFELAGFDGYDTPAGFAEFNRAVAALAAVYDGDGQAALTALSNSYFDLNGDFNMGPKHVFSQAGGDLTNPLFKIVNNNGDQIIVHDSWINEAEAGDERVDLKTVIRANPTSQDGLNGAYQTALYETNESPVDILRNEELILLYAEANILTGNTGEAATALNVIRNEWGLPNTSASAEPGLIDELLNQRRYSLWCENHRMFDLRRYGRGDDLPIDRAGDQIFNVLPVPLTENE
ncbi:RagB/SusD family nutrient uptake outer membrane protein [Robertkochia marina]|uniref:RagB/SusD family nutrient uptake outer membrane protein n=1 Tax=Robertkochia marina TaxID=1227945 RepID=A0A4S3M2T9_9FLAO|nr:RagB/SusD family nutrient uptake outer membrane protein [Robertkochia marina]THD69454.1 RagB/SusD family nutrient uptake outer membrane protein [Robertkochia marina]TRZ47285.1 RagB/SusD family nutrient uptake outer membrane protein [Robertkochia marina]